MTKDMYVSVPSYSEDSSTLLLLDSSKGSFDKNIQSVDVGFSTGNPLFGDTAMAFGMGAGAVGESKLLVDGSMLSTLFYGDWTIDWWECPITASSGSRFSSSYTTDSSSCGGILLGYHGTAVYASTSADASNWNIVTGNAMLSNTTWEWTHWAFVCYRSTLTSYRNGVKFAEVPLNDIIGWNSSYKFAIGNYRAGDLDPFVGYMDMFRISRGARWRGDFTPPTKSNGQYRKVKGIYVAVAPPTGYTPVEYLQSSGSQWIDSGVSIGTNTRVDADLMFDSAFGYNMMFGAWAHLSVALVGQNVVCAASGGGQTQNVGSTTASGVRYSIQIGAYHGYTQNGSYHPLGGSSNAATDRHILIFAASDGSTGNNPYAWGSYGVGKIYGLKIYNGETLVRDFVPCIRSDKVPGLYDLKNGAFYTNQGSGSFTCGPTVQSFVRRVKAGYVGAALPPGYTPLDYIQSTGEQFINSGVIWDTHDIRVQGEYEYTALMGHSSILGTQGATTNFILREQSGTLTWWMGPSDSASIVPVSAGQKIQFDLATNHSGSYTYSVSVAGGGAHAGSGAFTMVCDYNPIYVFDTQINGGIGSAAASTITCKAKLYSLKFYKGSALVRDFIPAVNPSGDVGLWDLVGSKFYGNAGKGSFTRGPENWSRVQSVARRFYEENISGIG